MEKRVIKFRAWNFDTKEMVENAVPVKWKAPEGKYYILGSGCNPTGLYGNQDTVETYIEIGDFAIMQLLAEKDRDGGEIYEQDIIEWDYEYDSDYDGDMPIVKRSTGREVVKSIFDTWRIIEARNEGKGVKVIGNIFQQPELQR
jgi:uncharacterized phage protein (TIGR01671 family)